MDIEIEVRKGLLPLQNRLVGGENLLEIAEESAPGWPITADVSTRNIRQKAGLTI